MTPSRSAEYDLVLVGGGLHAACLVLAVLHRTPHARIVVVESGSALGGNHTWCFHALDVSERVQPWVSWLVEQRWPEYEVCFPGHRRVVASCYSVITAERLRRVLHEQLSGSGCEVLLNSWATRIDAHRVVLEDGRELRGRFVVDATGPGAVGSSPGCGFQKFVGLEVLLKNPSNLRIPVLMDAQVPQVDGYRFLYILPFHPTRILAEDTYFSARPELDRDVVRNRIMAYLVSRGLRVERVLRDEHGVLPMPWGDAPTQPASGAFRAGYAGGWFHPATGYSFPMAVRVAELVAKQLAAGAGAGDALLEERRVHDAQARFARLLNRMLFQLIPPRHRWRVFRRFYRLPVDTIARFYALRMTRADQLRVLSGWSLGADGNAQGGKHACET